MVLLLCRLVMLGLCFALTRLVTGAILPIMSFKRNTHTNHHLYFHGREKVVHYGVCVCIFPIPPSQSKVTLYRRGDLKVKISGARLV